VNRLNRGSKRRNSTADFGLREPGLKNQLSNDATPDSFLVERTFHGAPHASRSDRASSYHN